MTFLARELVPGDVVILNMGDRVPADVRLYEVSSLYFLLKWLYFIFILGYRPPN